MKEKIHYIASTNFTIDQNYSELKVIGRGSYGVVCSAISFRLGRKVAIKKITPVAKHVSDAKHALREIILMRHMGKHENIITLLDLIFRERSDELYIVMELLDSDLHRIIQSKQQLTENHYKHFFHQLISGVKYLHDNRIIHRDLKPGNLLVSRDCNLRITDFGLARERPMGKGESPDDDIDEPMTEHVVTRWYRPPELMLCPDGMYTYAVDIWSCGCILAEMLGRNPLFPGKNFVNQLSLIFDVIGSPSSYQVRHVVNVEAIKFLKSQTAKIKVPFSTLFPEASEYAWDLLDELLLFDPDQRLTADEVLMTNFLHGVGMSSSKEFPAVSPDFNFSFEAAGNNRLQLKQMIHAEVASQKREANMVSKATEVSEPSMVPHNGNDAKKEKIQHDVIAEASKRKVAEEKKSFKNVSDSKASCKVNKDITTNANEVKETAATRNPPAKEAMPKNALAKPIATVHPSTRSSSAPKMRPSNNSSSGNTSTATALQESNPLSNRPRRSLGSSAMNQSHMKNGSIPERKPGNSTKSKVPDGQNPTKNLSESDPKSSYIIVDKDMQPKYKDNFISSEDTIASANITSTATTAIHRVVDSDPTSEFVHSRKLLHSTVEKWIGIGGDADSKATDNLSDDVKGTPTRRSSSQIGEAVSLEPTNSPGKKSILHTYMSPRRLNLKTQAVFCRELDGTDHQFNVNPSITNPFHSFTELDSHLSAAATEVVKGRTNDDSDNCSTESSDSSSSNDNDGSEKLVSRSSHLLYHDDDVSTVNNNIEHSKKGPSIADSKKRFEMTRMNSMENADIVVLEDKQSKLVNDDYGVAMRRSYNRNLVTTNDAKEYTSDDNVISDRIFEPSGKSMSEQKDVKTQDQHIEEAAEHAAINATSAAKKKKFTVARSPKFSVMSWQKKSNSNEQTTNLDVSAKPLQKVHLQNDKYYEEILKNLNAVEKSLNNNDTDNIASASKNRRNSLNYNKAELYPHSNSNASNINTANSKVRQKSAIRSNVIAKNKDIADDDSVVTARSASRSKAGSREDISKNRVDNSLRGTEAVSKATSFSERRSASVAKSRRYA